MRRPHEKDLRAASRIGIPIALQMGAEVGVFALAGLFAGHFGATSVAAHQIALMYGSLTFCVAVGVGSAGSVRVGWAVGAGRLEAARRAGYTAFASAAAFMSLTALGFWLLPGLLTRAMTTDPSVIATTVPLLAIAAVFQIFDGVQGAGAGVLRGYADTQFTFRANVFGHYAVGLPLALFLAFAESQGVTGLWWGLCAGLIVVAVALLLRFVRLSGRPVAAVA
jgi:MATE family multidrug resistance protein